MCERLLKVTVNVLVYAVVILGCTVSVLLFVALEHRKINYLVVLTVHVTVSKL